MKSPAAMAKQPASLRSRASCAAVCMQSMSVLACTT